MSDKIDEYCDECGTQLETDCLMCGAPVCCKKCCGEDWDRRNPKPADCRKSDGYSCDGGNKNCGYYNDGQYGGEYDCSNMQDGKCVNEYARESVLDI